MHTQEMCCLVILHMPLLLSSRGFFLVFGCRISFWVGPSLFFVNGSSGVSCDFGVFMRGKKKLVLSCVQVFATPWTIAHQAPLS